MQLNLVGHFISELQRVTTEFIIMSPIFIILLIVAVASAESPIRPEPIRDCGPYAAWVTCGTKCPLTCQNYKSPHRPLCPAGCQRGCVCIEGHIKKSATSYECVLPDACDN